MSPRAAGSRAVIVTGGGSGIGAALVRAFARRGDAVVAADRDLASARAVAGSVTGAVALEADVMDPAAVQRLVDGVVDRHGRLDVLVNNAGIGMGGPVEGLTPEHWRRVVEVNLMGVVHGVQAAYPVMLGQRDGHIVNLASVAGLVPVPLLTPYAATKHAVVGLSLSLRGEAAGQGVRVTVVCPGPVDTPILDRSGEPDLPAILPEGSGRALLSAAGRPYDPARLAVDILRGIDRNRAMIVRPGIARMMWSAFRLSPLLTVAVSQRAMGRARGSLEAARSGAGGSAELEVAAAVREEPLEPHDVA